MQSIIWHCIHVDVSVTDELLNYPCWALFFNANTALLYCNGRVTLIVALETAGNHLDYLPCNLWSFSLNSCLFIRHRNSTNYVTLFILLFTKTSENVRCGKLVEICPLLSCISSTHWRCPPPRSLFITEVLSTLHCEFLASTPYIIFLHLTHIPSQSLGRSGDRIPLGTRFSAPIQTGHATHSASYKMGTTSLSRG